MSQSYPYLLIMCGLPSSGKTTISKNVASLLEDKHGIPTMVVSSDDFRGMLSFSSQGFKPEREASVKLLYEAAIATGLEHSFVVISDDMNYYKSMRSDLRQIAKRSDSDYDIVFVDTPLNKPSNGIKHEARRYLHPSSRKSTKKLTLLKVITNGTLHLRLLTQANKVPKRSPTALLPQSSRDLKIRKDPSPRRLWKTRSR